MRREKVQPKYSTSSIAVGKRACSYGLAIVFIASLFSLYCAAQAADLPGGWEGTWTKQGDALPVTLNFKNKNGHYTGAFSSDAIQVANIPFSDVRDESGKVHWLLKGDDVVTTFDGSLAGDRLSGSFHEDKDTGSFVLSRATPTAAAIETRDILFADNDVKLSGTLLLPKAWQGRHPAILFLQGSGPEGRWANHWLAEKFATAGFVALIYDKRGVGQSTGNWQTAGFGALADDAAAGIRLLRSLPEVDPARIGLYGHSQGGTIAPLIAERAGALAFVIASAAGGQPPADVETYSVENFIGVPQLPPPEQADARHFVQAIIDTAYRGKSRAALDAVAVKFKTRSWYFDPPPPGNSYWAISRQIALFDPAQHWRHVNAPVLLVNGAHDERVPPEASLDAIAAAVRSGGNTHVTRKLYADADHTFTIVDPAHKTGWPRREPDYAETLTNWATSAVSR